jgi:hypothetical protein
MDLEEARKSLSRRRSFTPKRVAFFAAAALCLIAGIALRSVQYFAQPDAVQSPPATVEPSAPPAAPTPAVQATEPAPPPSPPVQDAATAPAEPAVPAVEDVEPAEQAAGAPEQVGAVDRGEQPELPGSGMILVSRKPIEVLASPSASSPALYGFPAGRPFRVIGHEGGFAHIQDLRSTASGWIEEAALAPSPSAPAALTPSQPKPFATKQKPASPSASAGVKPKSGKTGGTAAADPEPVAEPDAEAVAPPRRPGLFGRGGLLGGIFGGGN